MSSLPTPLSAADRTALGLAARKQLARSAHAAIQLQATHSRPRHDPLALLRASEAGRIPSLVKIKHERMAASAFGFFRGAVPIMAADLAAHPNTGLIAQLCGDAHVENLGAYADATGRLTFDINDFDESLRGPFEYDVKRLATSLILAGREAGIKRPARERAVLHFTAQYRRRMHTFARLPVLELARYQIHRLDETGPIPAIFAQAERSTPAKTLNSLTEPISESAKEKMALKGTAFRPSVKAGKETGVLPPARIFRSEPPRLTRVTGKQAALVIASLGPYARTLQPERRHFLDQYRVQDVGFKVVGTGSVGLRDYIVYLEGTHACPKNCEPSDPLFLQIKEEPASAYAPYLPEGSQHTHNGHRVMDGPRAMQLTSDPFLGYTTIDGRDYLVRQLNDHKAALDLATLTADSLLAYADLCGEIFARGHARSGDPVAIAAYLGTSARFDEAIHTFAHQYADQTEAYWAAFKKSLAPTKPSVKKKTATRRHS